jgi:hypothetical protein
MIKIRSIAVARSADFKLQVWAADPTTTQPWTRWKGLPTESAAWTPWQLFPIPLPITGDYYLFAAQLAHQIPQPTPTGVSAPVVRDTGRMQLWATIGLAPTYLYTTVKSTEQPNAPWGAWVRFDTQTTTVNPAIPEGAVASLSDGRLQVWSLTADVNGNAILLSRVQNHAELVVGYDGTQDWSGWQPFPQLPGGWTFWGDPTACKMPDGSTQLWIIGASVAGGSYSVWTCNRPVMQAPLPGPAADPRDGWGQWTQFTQASLKDNTPVNSIHAVADGEGRAYLWFVGDTAPFVWNYTYTASQPPVTWNQAVPFNFPSSFPGSVNFETPITIGVLPNGGLQLFMLFKTQTAYPIYTTWQESPQSPTSWHQGPLPGGWTDFSIP